MTIQEMIKKIEALIPGVDSLELWKEVPDDNTKEYYGELCTPDEIADLKALAAIHLEKCAECKGTGRFHQYDPEMGADCNFCTDGFIAAVVPQWIPIHKLEDLPTEGTWWVTWHDAYNNRDWLDRGEPHDSEVWISQIAGAVQISEIIAVMRYPMPEPYKPTEAE